MSEALFTIVTRGELAPGSDPEAVRARLQALCKYDAATLARVFSGETFRFKNDLDRATAERYLAALSATGIVCALQRQAAIPVIAPPPTTISCPKCGAEQPQAAICRACGIAIDKYQRQRQWPTQHPVNVPAPPAGGSGPGLLLKLVLAAVLLAVAGFAGYIALAPGKLQETVLYTTNGCGPCDSARDYLQSRGVPFTEINIAASEENRKAFEALNPSVLPLAFVNGERLDGFYENAYAIAVSGLEAKKSGVVDQSIVMYVAPGCRYCTQAHDYLVSRNIPFTELDINDPANAASYQSLNPVGTPLILIGGIRIDGFGQQSIDMALRQVGLD